MALAMMFIHIYQASSHFNIPVSICIKLQDIWRWVLFVSRIQDTMCLLQQDYSYFNTQISTAIYKPYHAQGHVISLRFKIM